jgi:DNA repair exonuclease SbcCD ATPase subunit
MNIQVLEQQINNLNNQFISKKTILEDRKHQLRDVLQNITATEDKINLFKRTSDFLNKFSSSLRESVSKKIENLVTQVLQRVLKDNRYEFKINFTQKRNATDASFLLFDKLNQSEIDIIDSSGGGVADIVSTILFFVFLEISNSKSDFIILDEVGKHISADKREEFFKLLKELSEEYNKQIIYVTHQNEALDVADNIIRLETGKDGFSSVVVDKEVSL